MSKRHEKGHGLQLKAHASYVRKNNKNYTLLKPFPFMSTITIHRQCLYFDFLSRWRWRRKEYGNAALVRDPGNSRCLIKDSFEVEKADVPSGGMRERSHAYEQVVPGACQVTGWMWTWLTASVLAVRGACFSLRKLPGTYGRKGIAKF